MLRRRANGQAGFVITLELVLIFTILGIGLLVGLVAIRNALFVWWSKKQAQTVWVYDSSDPVKVLGPVRDFDEHEAPRLFYIDRQFVAPTLPDASIDPTWVGHNYRAFVGVRDDRFTSRHRLFYTTADCSGAAACIAGPGEEEDDNRAVGSPSVGEAGGIGYLYPLQQGPSYGIGSDLTNAAAGGVGGFPGALYRSSAQQCEDTTITGIQSYWESQRVGYPCTPFFFTESGPITCPAGQKDNPGCTTDPPGNPLCQPTASECMCPVDYYRVNGQSGGGSNGNNCCPIGTVFVQGTGTCRGAGGLQQAVPVTAFNDEIFTPPFKVNLPPDPASFQMLAPGGGEGAPGIPTGTPYDPNSTVDYNVAPTSGEQGPP